MSNIVALQVMLDFEILVDEVIISSSIVYFSHVTLCRNATLLKTNNSIARINNSQGWLWGEAPEITARQHTSTQLCAGTGQSWIGTLRQRHKMSNDNIRARLVHVVSGRSIIIAAAIYMVMLQLTAINGVNLNQFTNITTSIQLVTYKLKTAGDTFQ
ncbi:hypothetical protein J6590_081955 [Homalodisca vitripennis]|nr:hypothetical protein J6590_081955 [Homalodisca vitripennis]